MPAQANLSNFEILNFFKHFFPGHKSEIDSSIKDKDFSRDRKLTLPVVPALLINMVRPGKGVGYQCVINRFFWSTWNQRKVQKSRRCGPVF